MELDFSAVGDISLWAYLLTFVGGLVTSIGPCNIAMIPLVIAFVGGQKDIGRGRSLLLSAAFALGLALTLALLGVIAAVVGGIIGGSSHIWYYVVAAVCIVMGLHWLGVIALPLPDWGVRSREKIKRRGAWGALLLGLASGLVSSGCATPALAAILTLVMSKGAVVYGASLLLVYGLGRGVPIVLLGTFAGLVKHLPRLSQWTHRVEQASGALMIALGAYFLWIA
jgi:cytochrome c-type biogenesis protein